MRTGSGQMGLQAGGSTMITPSALAASGDATNDTRTANTIRGRIGIRRMAVSSPGRPTLAAAWVRDAARVVRVPALLDEFRWMYSQRLVSHRVLQNGEGPMDLVNDGGQLFLLGCCGLGQCAENGAVVPERSVATALEMQPEIVPVDAVTAEHIPHVGEFVGCHYQPHRIRLSPEPLDKRVF